MKKLTALVSTTLLAFYLSLSAQAAPILAFSNDGSAVSQTITQGDNVSLELWVSGLENVNLGGFDIELFFDPSVSLFQSALFSAEWLDFSDLIVAGNRLSLASVSSLFDLSTQPDSLLLATLQFSAGAVGTSLVNFGNILLSDELAQPFSTDWAAATIEVQANSTGIPEPQTWLLMLLAIALIRLQRSRTYR
ncbi:hypothetical protein [Bowmanella denitrificans]|uniref:hypothetical protein n=1 Tax=Bowmanella denitrificans TaxID=366582 RepID=UPI000C9B88F3|nr:hypothetical protein [Bowmanella denitrificans]